MGNHDNQIFVVSAGDQSLYVDMEMRRFVDLDELFGVQGIKSVIYDREDEAFYLLCNKMNGALGLYLIMFEERQPENHKIITSWRHNLSIGDTCIYISRGLDKDNKAYKELICGFKTIYINTFTTTVLDLGADITKGRQTLAKHESFQLWESPVTGLLLRVSKDFITFSKSGMNVLALGSLEMKIVKDNLGFEKILHSLNSLSYLKVDPQNFVNCRCQTYENRVISIEQENQRKINGKLSTIYEELYKIKIHEITLRELLILQSLYVSKT
jgi:hypothetical protein